MRYAHSLGSMSSAKMEGKLKKPLDFINIALQVIEHLLSWPGPEIEATIKMPYLVIVSEKKNKRAYIIKDCQIVSFAFPFQVYDKIDSISGQKVWHVRYKEIDISSAILSHCRGLYSDYEAYNEKKSFREIASAQNLADTDVLKAIRLFEFLMLAEPAYVRYDYDPKEENGLKHPLCHFDHNFIDEHHYKIGLHGRVNLSEIEDMIDKNTDSWFVAKYKESIQEKQKRLKTRFAKVKGRNLRKKRSGRRKRH